MGNNAELQNIRQNLSGYVEIDELNAPADLQVRSFGKIL